jgi:putative glutamine amidotransferase
VRIALTLDRDAGRRERNDYVESLLRAGAQPEEILLLLPDRAADGEFDGLVLGGGGDVDPSRYGESARDGARVEIDPARDRLDFRLFQKARLDELPVFGICRGLQVINVALGGTLLQDIPSERPSAVIHRGKAREQTRRDHPISIRPGTRLHRAAGANEITVNSRHHQAIAEPAPGLVVSAFSPDGLVEGIETAEEPWLLAVQWHPENLAGDRVSERLFAEFLRAVRHRAPAKV